MDKRIVLIGLAVLLCFGIVEALEIKSGTSEDLTIFLQNATTGIPIQNATCVLDVWLPNGTKTLNDGAMTELAEGFYYYSTSVNWTTAGNYRVLAKCTVGIDSYYSAMMFTVVATTVTEWFETINTTTSDTYNYLQNTIYPAVDTLEASMASVLANQTNLWNKLVEIQGNVTTNYNEIINTQSQLTDVNTSVMTELNDHKNRLIEINGTVTEILANITQTVNPKLDQLQTDIDLIKGYTDTLEAGQIAILGNVSAIQSTVDSIETKTDNVIGYVDTLEDQLNCNGSVDTIICNKLDVLNTTVNTINTNTDSLEAGQTTITNYIDSLESGQTNILSATTEIKEMLNCSVMITSSVCWRLDLIQNYTGSLESGQQTIQNYVDTLETGQTGILANLSIIIGYVDTVESGIADLDSDIQNMNSTVEMRFDAIDGNLSAITTTVNEILSDQDSINVSQTALLNQILTITTSANSTVNWIENYLNGTVTAYLADINQTVTVINQTVTAINQTVTDIYNLLIVVNSTVNSIYSDTQNVLAKWDTYTMQQIWNKLDSIDNELDNISSAVVNNTEVLNALNGLESIVNSTRNEIGFEGQSLTAYQYFVQLESELINVNTTLFNKIEFEHNATLNQILNAIQSNTTAIISEVNANEVKLDSILTNWGSYTAADIINNVTANRNQLINLENWLDAFNTTEEIRHNDSKSIINTVLAWLGIFNQSEAQRHNITQTKINNLFNEVNDTEELSNQIIAMLGYGGKNSTVYDDLISLYNQNAQIITLAQEINLTTSQTLNLLFAVNDTVTLIYNDTQDVLSKWSNWTAQNIMDKLNIMDSKIDTIQTSSNNTDVLNALDGLESIVNSTRNEIGFEGQSLTAYQYFVQLESELINVNTTLFNKIEFEHNATLNQMLSAIQNSTTTIVNEVDANEVKLDSILTNWGSYTAADIINNVTANRNKLIDLENWLNAFNLTEEIRHNDSKSLIQSTLDWLGVFNSTESARHTQTQNLINNLFDEVNDTEELSNQIIAMLGYSGKNITVFEDLANLSLKLEQVIVLTTEINLTTQSIEDKVDNQIIPKLDSIVNETNNILANWGNYTANDLYTKSLNIETKVDNMQVWLNSFNATEQQRYADVIDEVNDTEELLTAIRAELGFEGQSLTAYEYFVQIDSELDLINTSLWTKIQTEHLTTRQDIEAAVSSNMTAIISEINDNEADLLTLLTNWGNNTADDIINNITENRNQLNALQAWLNLFNTTEETRHNQTQGLIQGLINLMTGFNASNINETLTKLDDVLTSVDEAKNLSNDIITMLGYSGINSTVYDDTVAVMGMLATVIAQIGNVTGTDSIVLDFGNNVLALPIEPSNTSIEFVMSNVTGKYERVDHWNPATQEWEIYVPGAPFGNTLDTMETGEVYWIFTTEACILYIN